MSLDALLSYELEAPEELLPPQVPPPNLLVQKRVAEARVRRLEKPYASKIETLNEWNTTYLKEWDKFVDMKTVLKEKRDLLEQLKEKENHGEESTAEIVDLVTLQQEVEDLRAGLEDSIETVEEAKAKVGGGSRGHFLLYSLTIRVLILLTSRCACLVMCLTHCCLPVQVDEEKPKAIAAGKAVMEARKKVRSYEEAFKALPAEEQAAMTPKRGRPAAKGKKDAQAKGGAAHRKELQDRIRYLPVVRFHAYISMCPSAFRGILERHMGPRALETGVNGALPAETQALIEGFSEVKAAADAKVGRESICPSIAVSVCESIRKSLSPSVSLSLSLYVLSRRTQGLR
jgi:hypothetical protein